MRAVNLIPVEDRRSAGAPGRTGGAVYVALGVLAVIVLASAAYAITTNQVNERKADLQRATLEANSTEAQAAAVKPYADFAQLKSSRLATVQSLAESRFDWHGLMDQMARAIPANVWLTSLKGTVAADATGGASSPSIAITGCTTSHKEVARMMTRMRLLEGVSGVSLSASEKGGSGGGGDAGDCTNGHADYPSFTMTISLAAPAAGAAGQSTGSASTQPASSGGTP